VLIYAVDRGSAQHERAQRWPAQAFEAPAGVGFAWVALLGFVRITPALASSANRCSWLTH
jgi:hypothetical protein